MSEEKKVLTKEIAEEYSRESWSVNLADYNVVDPAAAQILARQEGWLNLSGLTELSPDTAEILAAHKGDLNINGIKELSDAAALPLAKHHGGISLGGLTSMSESVAASLASSNGSLRLNGLTSLSDDAAKALGNTCNSLSLDAVQNLTDEAAAIFAKHSERISFKGLQSLRGSLGHIALASKLANQTGEHELPLKLLSELSPQAAEALAQFKGSLLLDGLTNLSAELATALAKHQGWLSLNGLPSLSKEAATSLTKHSGGISLAGITELSEWLAQSLASMDGMLGLKGLTQLSPSAAEKLSVHKGLPGRDAPLDLDGLLTLSDEVAKHLSKHEGRLYMSGLGSLSESAAAALSERNGLLVTSGEAADSYNQQCAHKLREFAKKLSFQDDAELVATLNAEFQPGDGYSICEAILTPERAYQVEFLGCSDEPPRKWPPCWLFQCQSGSREPGSTLSEGGEMYLLEFADLLAKGDKRSALDVLLAKAKQLGIKPLRPKGKLYFFEQFDPRDANISDEDVAAAERGESSDLFADGLGGRGGVYRAWAREADHGISIDALSAKSFGPHSLLATNGPLVSEDGESLDYDDVLKDGADVISVADFGDRPRDCSYVFQYQVDNVFQEIA